MPYEFTDTYQRNANDFYIEPRWCIEALIRTVNFVGQIHDPACGSGKIPTTFATHGFTCTASDITDRGFGNPTKNFLQDSTIHDNIVTNPPYNLSERFINHALRHTIRRTAILARLAFLSSQKRFDLFTIVPPEKIVVLSRRPSMPPGGLGIIPQGGKTDFCWVVWNQGHVGLSEICWVL